MEALTIFHELNDDVSWLTSSWGVREREFRGKDRREEGEKQTNTRRDFALFNDPASSSTSEPPRPPSKSNSSPSKVYQGLLVPTRQSKQPKYLSKTSPPARQSCKVGELGLPPLPQTLPLSPSTSTT